MTSATIPRAPSSGESQPIDADGQQTTVATSQASDLLVIVLASLDPQLARAGSEERQPGDVDDQTAVRTTRGASDLPVEPSALSPQSQGLDVSQTRSARHDSEEGRADSLDPVSGPLAPPDPQPAQDGSEKHNMGDEPQTVTASQLNPVIPPESQTPPSDRACQPTAIPATGEPSESPTSPLTSLLDSQDDPEEQVRAEMVGQTATILVGSSLGPPADLLASRDSQTQSARAGSELGTADTSRPVDTPGPLPPLAGMDERQTVAASQPSEPPAYPLTPDSQTPQVARAGSEEYQPDDADHQQTEATGTGRPVEPLTPSLQPAQDGPQAGMDDGQTAVTTVSWPSVDQKTSTGDGMPNDPPTPPSQARGVVGTVRKSFPAFQCTTDTRNCLPPRELTSHVIPTAQIGTLNSLPRDAALLGFPQAPGLSEFLTNVRLKTNNGKGMIQKRVISVVLSNHPDKIGNIWFLNTSKPPIISLRILKSLILEHGEGEEIAEGPIIVGGSVAEVVRVIQPADFLQLLKGPGFGKTYWNQVLEDAFVTLEVLDHNLVRSFVRLGIMRTEEVLTPANGN